MLLELTTRQRCVLLVWMALFSCLMERANSVANAADVALTPAFRFSDIDLNQTRQLRDGKDEPVDADQVRRSLGFSSKGQSWNFSDSKENREVVLQYLLVFKEPMAVGTTSFQMEGHGWKQFQSVAYLNPQFQGKPDPGDAKQWTRISEAHVFPAGFKTRAFLLTDRRTRSKSIVANWYFLKSRLFNVTRQAVGIAEKAPFGAHPNSIPQGHTWMNTATDPSPGATKRLLRGPVSEALPSWYMLTWEQPQTLAGVYLSSNTDKFQLYAYRGDPKANPALAPAADWRRIEFAVQDESTSGKELSDRLIAFSSVSTQALKLEMLSCRKSPVATIRKFDAWVDLGDAPVPTVEGEAILPYTIAYEQPFDGQFAMVVTDTAGRTVRNLVAQVQRSQGQGSEIWDLKDEWGQTVAPGEYRWKAITAPPLSVRYQFTPYPNASMYFPERTPWQTTESGPNGWLADHTTNTSGATVGDRVYFGAPGVEGGVGLIECDLEGRKLWGKHGFAAFSGVKRLAGDHEALFIHERDRLYRMSPQTHEITPIATLGSAARLGNVTGMTATEGKIYLSFLATIPAFDNATTSDVVDLDHCLPRYPAKIPDLMGNRRVEPNPRKDFLRLLRLTGTPAGQQPASPNKREPLFPIQLESAGEDSRHQYVVVAFKAPTPLGSLVFPCPEDGTRVELSVLKASAAYPPNPSANQDWVPFETQAESGWVCLPAPANTMTRAVRIRFVKSGEEPTDPLDSLLSKKSTTNEPDLDGLGKKKSNSDPLGINFSGGAGTSSWFGRLDGLKLLRRRFTSLIAAPEIQVNSGTINKQGEWDAQRSDALSGEHPGIYLMQWKEKQKIAGLAIKEIDGELTEIDVWEGPDAAPVTMAGERHWRQIATYTQARRDAYQPAFERNEVARYLDGYVDFQEQVETRAVRLRVVKQWADLNMRGTASQRRDRGGQTLDPRRCQIWGVAALKYLGGEPAVDALTYQRIEVRDAKNGNHLRDLPGVVDHSLCAGPRGDLFGIQKKRIVKVDPQTGAATPVISAIDGEIVGARRFTVSPAGEFYVFVLPENVIHVYSAAGEKLRTIGHAGNPQPGPWDPLRFLEVNEMVVDHAHNLWVVESQYVPRRIIHYKTDGTFVKEMLGNTPYGGGGVLDRFDKSRMYFHHVQFELDWRTGKSRIKNLLDTWMPADYVPVRVGGRTYLASAPLSYQSTQDAATVYLVDEKTGTARLVAGFGKAHKFDRLKASAIQAKLAAGKVLADYSFLWSDQNGNGEVDADEVQFEPKDKERDQEFRFGRFNEQLRCCGGSAIYQVKEILANGTPVFERKPCNVPAILQLNDGSLLSMNVSGGVGRNGRKGQETHVHTPDGTKRWSYATDYTGVSGLFLPPWRPGYVTNEFGVIGHEVATAGELGEFYVVHGNNGIWKVWTADGLLAGTILRHKLDPGSTSLSSFDSITRDDPLENLSAGQEHFHGFFTKTDEDGKYYILHGGNFIMVSEVTGLDKFKRLEGKITVSADDVRRVRAWEEEQARREVKSLAQVMDCLPVTDKGPAEVAELDDVRFSMGHDAESLYLRWNVRNLGPLKNTGSDFRRLFKTGAALDVHMSIDPQASPGRQKAARGDLRLLFTYVDDQPIAVLYDAVNSEAGKQDAWETFTPAGGTTSFDRVVKLNGVKMQLKNDSTESYTCTAAVPLKVLGLKIQDGIRVKFDWGVLASDDGRSVKRRLYWSNQLATGTTDEAIEARLEPHLWGHVTFASKSKDEQRLSDSLRDGKDAKKPRTSVDDLLDDVKKGKP